MVPGPRDDWFADPDALVRTDWVASDRSDRVGMRLTGRRCNPAGPTGNSPARAPSAAQFRCRPTGYPSSSAPTIR